MQISSTIYCTNRKKVVDRLGEHKNSIELNSEKTMLFFFYFLLLIILKEKGLMINQINKMIFDTRH